MDFQIILVLTIVAAAVVLFASEKFSVDMVAIMILGALLLLGLVTPEEGISGFSNPATVTVAAMFVLSAGLSKTGALRAVGRTLIRLGRNRIVLLLLVMLTTGVVSAFINNTAAVAVFLPLVLAVCAKRKISSSKLLIPMSFASEFAGVCTLIGTSTNLLVSSISDSAGYGAFSMFEMGKLGLILCAIGVVYFLVVGWWLLPDRRGEELTAAYQLGEYITELRVLPDCPLIGKTIMESGLGKEHDVTVLEIMRDKQKMLAPLREAVREGDILLVRGKMKDLMDLKSSKKLEIEPEFKLKDAALESGNLTLVEAMVAPRSRLTGHTLAELNFRRRYNAIVLAMLRRQHTIREKLSDVRFRFGDALLLLMPKEDVERIRRDEHLIMLEEVEEPALRRSKVPIVLAIMTAVVVLAALKIMPIVVTAVIGAIVMILFRCLTLNEAYEAIDMRVIFLLASVLPLGLAMEKTGAAQLIAQTSVGLVGGFGLIAILATFYILTAILTECMSNNASAALLAPIAISTAVQLGVDPKPLLMAVTFAASTSFATPVGYQTNMMVYNPGGYRFTDFMKVGIPLICLFCVVSVYFIPKFWPF